MCQAELKDASPKPLKVINPVFRTSCTFSHQSVYSCYIMRCLAICKYGVHLTANGLAIFHQSKSISLNSKLRHNYRYSCSSISCWARHDSCVKHRIPCTHCTREIARGDLAAHMAACKKRPVSCQHCTSSMAFDLLAPHIANTCVKAPTVCDAFTLPPGMLRTICIAIYNCFLIT